MSSRSWQDAVIAVPVIARLKHKLLIRLPPGTCPAIEAVCLRYGVNVSVEIEMNSVRPCQRHRIRAQTRCYCNSPRPGIFTWKTQRRTGHHDLLGPASTSDSLAPIQISQRCGASYAKADILYRYPAI
jgi:hypothetical protein